MDKVNVLIVEDEALMALFIRRVLEREGYVISHIASTGPDAVRSAATKRPDIVLMDIRLAGPMDGIEAAESIRALYERLPVILMSGYSREDVLDRAYAIQPAGFLEKPFDISELAACVKAALPAGDP